MTTPIVIGLSAVVAAMRDGELLALTVRPEDVRTHRASALPGLPSGPFEPESAAHLRAGAQGVRDGPDRVRARLLWSSSTPSATRAGARLCPTSAPPSRHRGRGSSPSAIWPLAPETAPETTASDPGEAATDARWSPWTRFFPWEDWPRRPTRSDRRGDRASPGRLGQGPRRAAVAGAEPVRPRRRALERGAGAGPLRAALRSRPSCRSRARPGPRLRSGQPPTLRLPARLRPADGVRPSPHPGDRARAPPRQAEVSPGGVRADARDFHPLRPAAGGGGDLRRAAAQAEFPPNGGAGRGWWKASGGFAPRPAGARRSFTATNAKAPVRPPPSAFRCRDFGTDEEATMSQRTAFLHPGARPVRSPDRRRDARSFPASRFAHQRRGSSRRILRTRSSTAAALNPPITDTKRRPTPLTPAAAMAGTTATPSRFNRLAAMSTGRRRRCAC